MPLFGDIRRSTKRTPNYSINRGITGEHWDECSTCGFAIPHSETVKHYKKGTLVCMQCADDRTHADNMEFIERREQTESSPAEQPVRDDGEQ